MLFRSAHHLDRVANVLVAATLQPGDLIFAIAGDANRPWEHVRLLARLSRITIDEASRRRLREARDDAALLAALQAEDARHG